MPPSALRTALSYPTAARENRLRAAEWLLDNPSELKELLHIVLEEHSKLSEKAAWALEFAFLRDPNWLLPEFDLFFDRLQLPENDSITRPLSHICEKICHYYYHQKKQAFIDSFKVAHRKKLVEVAFDWLINDYRVACKVRAMTCLYWLGTEFSWIHPELSAILQDSMYDGSPGYKNRGAKILAQLRQRPA